MLAYAPRTCAFWGVSPKYPPETNQARGAGDRSFDATSAARFAGSLIQLDGVPGAYAPGYMLACAPRTSAHRPLPPAHCPLPTALD